MPLEFGIRRNGPDFRSPLWTSEVHAGPTSEVFAMPNSSGTPVGTSARVCHPNSAFKRLHLVVAGFSLRRIAAAEGVVRRRQKPATTRSGLLRPIGRCRCGAEFRWHTRRHVGTGVRGVCRRNTVGQRLPNAEIRMRTQRKVPGRTPNFAIVRRPERGASAAPPVGAGAACGSVYLATRTIGSRR